MPFNVRIGSKHDNREYVQYKLDQDENGQPLTSFSQCYDFITRVIQREIDSDPDYIGELLLIQKVSR